MRARVITRSAISAGSVYLGTETLSVAVMEGWMCCGRLRRLGFGKYYLDDRVEVLFLRSVWVTKDCSGHGHEYLECELPSRSSLCLD